MRTLILIATVFVFSCANIVAGETIPGFHYGDAASAFDAAKQKNQIIMIDFFTTWCGPCKLLDKNIYQNTAFKAYTEKMVCYKIDAEKGEGLDMANKYNIRVYPSVVFVDASGREIERKIGYEPDIKRYLLEVDRILEGKDILPKWLESFEKDKSFDAAIKAANYYMVYDLSKAETFYQFVIEADKMKEKKGTKELMAHFAINQLYYGTSKERASYAENFITQFQETDQALNLMSDLAFYYARRGEKEKGWTLFMDRYNRADDKTKETLSSSLREIKLLTDHASKDETYQAIAELDMNDPSDVSKAAGWYHKWNDNPLAERVLGDWLKKNPEANLNDLNNVGWTAFEVKVLPAEFARAMIQSWNNTPESDLDSYKADTIANLCELCGDKMNAIKFGEIAVKMIPEKSRLKKEFEKSLERYKAMN